MDFFGTSHALSQRSLDLYLDARCINATCDAGFMARVLEVLAAAIKSDVSFEGSLSKLVVHTVDHQFNPKGTLITDWQNVVDFANGRITFEQLTRRAWIYAFN